MQFTELHKEVVRTSLQNLREALSNYDVEPAPAGRGARDQAIQSFLYIHTLSLTAISLNLPHNSIHFTFLPTNNPHKSNQFLFLLISFIMIDFSFHILPTALCLNCLGQVSDDFAIDT